MPNPWDIPPLPSSGDANINATYEAVGRAMSGWEKAEVALAHLFSVMSGFSRFSPEGNREYGHENIFTYRMTRLEEKAREYFIRNPDQNLEGRFTELANRSRKLSTRRNEIAHCIATQARFNKVTGYCIRQPTHGYRNFEQDSNIPKFIYTSKEIDKFSKHFARLSIDVDKLATRIISIS